MKTKTWNIGEYAKGGVITVEIKGDIIGILCKEWDFSAGSTKDSDQSNARVLEASWIDTKGAKWHYMVEETLNELTSYYYASIIMEWIQENL